MLAAVGLNYTRLLMMHACSSMLRHLKWQSNRALPSLAKIILPSERNATCQLRMVAVSDPDGCLAASLSWSDAASGMGWSSANLAEGRDCLWAAGPALTSCTVGATSIA